MRAITLSVLLDFSKDFETIDNEILINNLDLYGIRGHMNSWYVEINELKESAQLTRFKKIKKYFAPDLSHLHFRNDYDIRKSVCKHS